MTTAHGSYRLQYVIVFHIRESIDVRIPEIAQLQSDVNEITHRHSRRCCQ